MKITFLGEGTDGQPIRYDSWRELAEAVPLGQINPASLRPVQTEYLVAEFRNVVSGEGVKDGHVWTPAGKNLYPKIETHIAFATINLPILEQSDADSLLSCERTAMTYLKGEIGDFEHFGRALVRRNGKNWRVVKLPSMGRGGVACDRLADLYNLGLEYPFTAIWHAVRLLVHARRAREAVKIGDAQVALELGMVVGESHRALDVKIAVMTSGGKGGGASKDTGEQSIQDRANRDCWLRERAVEMRKQPAFQGKAKIDKLAKCLERELAKKVETKDGYWRAIKHRAIRDIIEVW